MPVYVKLQYVVTDNRVGGDYFCASSCAGAGGGAGGGSYFTRQNVRSSICAEGWLGFSSLDSVCLTSLLFTNAEENKNIKNETTKVF